MLFDPTGKQLMAEAVYPRLCLLSADPLSRQRTCCSSSSFSVVCDSICFCNATTCVLSLSTARRVPCVTSSARALNPLRAEGCRH